MFGTHNIFYVMGTMSVLNPMPISPIPSPKLLTDGPISTTRTVKQAMNKDYSSKESTFIQTNQRVLAQLLKLAEVSNDTHTVIPLQGTGTYIVEALISSLVPRDRKLLILINGTSSQRMAQICDYLDQDYVAMEVGEQETFDLTKLETILETYQNISHVAMVHCETSTGLINPVEAISQVVQKHNKRLIIDCMNTFGAIKLNPKKVQFDGMATCSNKCLQGVPGFAFGIVNKQSLAAKETSTHSLALDLHAQWQQFETNGQWRFTPPIQSVLALEQALKELKKEGGINARLKRYQKNFKTLDNGMQKIGFKRFISDDLQSPILLTYHIPNHGNFDFHLFSERLKHKGFVIYPGKLSKTPTFRIGCIGDLYPKDMKQAVMAVQNTLGEMNVSIK